MGLNTCTCFSSDYLAHHWFKLGTCSFGRGGGWLFLDAVMGGIVRREEEEEDCISSQLLTVSCIVCIGAPQARPRQGRAEGRAVPAWHARARKGRPGRVEGFALRATPLTSSHSQYSPLYTVTGTILFSYFLNSVLDKGIVLPYFHCLDFSNVFILGNFSSKFIV